MSRFDGKPLQGLEGPQLLRALEENFSRIRLALDRPNLAVRTGATLTTAKAEMSLNEVAVLLIGNPVTDRRLAYKNQDNVVVGVTLAVI